MRKKHSRAKKGARKIKGQIELAAARVSAMTVDQIAARLDDRFRLLTGGSRTALPRQQTLKALIDWSWDLLSEAEHGLLRGLSVFTGGWTLEGAEAVCGSVAGVREDDPGKRGFYGLMESHSSSFRRRCRMRARKTRWFLYLAGVLLVASFGAGCNDYSYGPNLLPLQPGTPLGKYTIGLTGTLGNDDTVVRTTTINLAVGS